MASNKNARIESSEKRASRENRTNHFDIISQSINCIVKNSKNTAFQLEISQMLNVKINHRKRNIRTESFKLMKANIQRQKYDDTQSKQT